MYIFVLFTGVCFLHGRQEETHPVPLLIFSHSLSLLFSLSFHLTVFSYYLLHESTHFLFSLSFKTFLSYIV